MAHPGLRTFLSLVTAPTAEPVLVSLADAKTHLRVDVTTDDALITALLQAAREAIEQVTGRALLTQRWTLTLDGFPAAGEALELPKPPLAATPAVVLQYRDTAGVLQTWAASKYLVARPAGPTALPAYIHPAPDEAYPIAQARPDAVIVDFTCGVASAADLPAAYKAAMLLLVGHFYEHREAVGAGALAELPLGVLALIAPYELVALV